MFDYETIHRFQVRQCAACGFADGSACIISQKSPREVILPRMRFRYRSILQPKAIMSDINITVTDRHGRKCASSGSKWEPLMGYSRAVRSGNFIAVTGTVGVNADGTYSKSLGDQTARSLAIIKAAIESLGGRIENVIRTRMYVTDLTQWEQVAKIHGSVFGEIRPATTIVEVTKLIDGEAQIEIEADAVV